MKTFHAALGAAAACALGVGGALIMPASRAAASGLPVFDVANYAQNLLQAARALSQISNQVKSLQNETAMLETMRRNLKTIDFPQLQRITSAMQRIDALMGQAEGLQFKVQGLDQQVRTLFPGALGEALTSDQRVARARAELDAATAGYRQAMSVQAQVAENVTADSAILGELATTSQNAVGALQVGQSANQLLALGVKQQIQLQSLMASEFRGAALDRARRLQAAEDGRAGTRRFLDGAAAKQP